MMKLSAILIFNLILVITLQSQSDIAALQAAANLIKNETHAGQNTANRVGGTLLNMVNSSVNILTPQLTTSSTNGYVWTAVGTTGLGSWQPGGGGTVTSVAASVPSFLSISGSPITTSGTLAITANSQSANKFLGSPIGSSGTPSFRGVDALDIVSPFTSDVTWDVGGFSLGIADVTNNAGIFIGSGGTQLFTLNGALTFSGDGTTPTTFEDETGLGKGLVYVTDYSTTFVNNSLVSKGYVDHALAFGNALTATTLQTTRSIYGNNFDGSAALNQIITSVYGGTGNGFTKFTGPASFERTFTLPNTSATILTTSLPVTTAQGGTGANSANDGFNALAPAQTSNSGKFLTTDGTNTSWATVSGSSGTVTTVGFTGGVISVANPTTTPAFTVAGTSGGIPYFSSTSTWASSALLAANALMIGGGAGTAPSTTTTGTGVLTALGVNVGSAGAFITFNGAGGTPSSLTGTNITGLPLGTGVTGTLPVANGGTGQTSYTIGDIIYASSSSVLSKLAVGASNTVLHGGTTPAYSVVSLTSDVGNTLPVVNGGTGITSLGTGVAPWMGTPSSANLATAITDETGSGAAVFGTTPTISTPVINGLPTGTGIASVATASTLMARDANANTLVNNAIFGYVTTATAAGTTTLTVSSARDQYFTGITTQTIVLPVATMLSTNQSFVIVNQSTGAITVQTSGSNVIKVMATNSTLVVRCTNPSGGTGTASWTSSYSAPYPLTTQGDIILASATINDGVAEPARLGIGANGTVLQSNGTTASWVTAGGGVSGSTNQIPVMNSSTTAAGTSELTYSARTLLFGTSSSGHDILGWGSTTNALDMNFATGEFRSTLGSGNFFTWIINSTEVMRMPTATKNVLIGSATDNARLYVVGASAASAWLPPLRVDFGAPTALTANQEFNATITGGSGSTWTWVDGTVPTQRINYDKAHVLNGTTTLATFTDAFGRFVETPTAGAKGAITNPYGIGTNGSIKMTVAGNKLFITEGSNGSVGQTTLVSGVKAITVTGTTTSTRCILTLVTQGGTVTTTAQYGCVCTANTVTVTALTNAAATNTLDTSVLNYWLVN